MAGEWTGAESGGVNYTDRFVSPAIVAGGLGMLGLNHWAFTQGAMLRPDGILLGWGLIVWGVLRKLSRWVREFERSPWRGTGPVVCVAIVALGFGVGELFARTVYGVSVLFDP